MHKNGNVKAITLWLRIILNNISWHVKASLLSFASSLFIVWAFMSCVLERGPNPGCHTQNHMVHLFLTEDVVGFCISKSSSHPTSTHSHLVEGKENMAPVPSLERGCLVHIQEGIGQGIARVPRVILEESLLYGHSHP